MSLVVVGGGISGVACASAAAATGMPVTVRDRGHRLGGRMASRTLRDTGTAFDGRVVDIGASYFTASHPDFLATVTRLEAEGIVRPWSSGFHVAGPDGISGVSGGPMRYAAPRGLRSVVEALACDLVDVQVAAPVVSVEVTADGLAVDAAPADAVALCLPGPQAARVAPWVPVPAVTWEPVIAVTLVFAEATWPDLDGVFVNDDPVITWIADDGSRRGDLAPVLVAHVHPVLAARHLDDPSSVIPAVVAAVQRVLAVSALPDWVEVHRWSYARPLSAVADPFLMVEDAPVGLAGDAFAAGPKVEAAWLSGHLLGAALAARLGA